MWDPLWSGFRSEGLPMKCPDCYGTGTGTFDDTYCSRCEGKGGICENCEGACSVDDVLCEECKELADRVWTVTKKHQTQKKSQQEM